MLRLGLSAALLLAAAPAFAQPGGAGGPDAGIQQAAMAFGECVKTAAEALPATVAPEAGAASALRGCTAQKQALEAAVTSMINTAVPEAQRPAALEQLRTRMSGVEAQIADGIRRHRAAPASAPATSNK